MKIGEPIFAPNYQPAQPFGSDSMQLLLALWAISLALAAVSLLGMAALLIGRPIRARRDRQIARSRSAILQLLIGHDRSKQSLRRHVARAARLKILSSIVLEALGIIRGSARASFVAQLTDAGAGRALRVSMEYGRAQDRQRAVEALAAFAPLESERALQKAWWDTSPAVRFTAMRASIDIGAPPALADVLRLVAGAGPADRALALRVLESLARIQPIAAGHAIGQADLPPVIRAKLIDSLALDMNPATVSVLMTASTDADAAVRAAAIRALGLASASSSITAVVRAFSDPSWAVRAVAAEAAGRLRLVTTEPFLKHLRRDAHWWVRLKAADALEVLTSEQKQAAIA